MLRFGKNLIHLLSALIASLFYGFPGRKMTVIGITGTDGKTTTSHLVYHILKTSGKKVSLISTLAAFIGEKDYDTGFHVTTPSSWQLQRFMKEASDGGSEYFVLEVTSHALDQYRVFGSSIDIGLINNISHEHIDYHKTIDHYRRAKAKILQGVKYRILNSEDKSFDYLHEKGNGKLVTFALHGKADYTQDKLRLHPRILGKFNLSNAVAAASVALVLKIDKLSISKAIANFTGIPGRMEEVITDKKFKIFIDFAHKPNALEKALETARERTKRKLIVVFGCAGLRDRLKRPMMGEIAGNLADYAIFTAEDPRTEDVRDIIDQIAVGCLKTTMKEADKRKDVKVYCNNDDKYFWRISDRQEAINFTLRKLVKDGDVVLICGKGHEKSICYGKIEYPWDEKKAINKALYDTVKTSH
ncbi:UDP-N-acetylmuramoyl-L-alanyl-D-glutamate--2,6-diaminopimelate ligase [Candidatus Gottesmanbacteria bacterium]|nr:UDP-N-acetylmuramoyl-L-alanyl-D-glutamate--2,6-diaminopimelate ligase [Candidatus Gottesmanbacteria bacterium]